jgi:hypothetical protein
VGWALRGRGIQREKKERSGLALIFFEPNKAEIRILKEVQNLQRGSMCYKF